MVPPQFVRAPTHARACLIAPSRYEWEEGCQTSPIFWPSYKMTGFILATERSGQEHLSVRTFPGRLVHKHFFAFEYVESHFTLAFLRGLQKRDRSLL